MAAMGAPGNFQRRQDWKVGGVGAEVAGGEHGPEAGLGQAWPGGGAGWGLRRGRALP